MLQYWVSTTLTAHPPCRCSCPTNQACTQPTNSLHDMSVQIHELQHMHMHCRRYPNWPRPERKGLRGVPPDVFIESKFEIPMTRSLASILNTCLCHIPVSVKHSLPSSLASSEMPYQPPYFLECTHDSKQYQAIAFHQPLRPSPGTIQPPMPAWACHSPTCTRQEKQQHKSRTIPGA